MFARSLPTNPYKWICSEFYVLVLDKSSLEVLLGYIVTDANIVIV